MTNANPDVALSAGALLLGKSVAILLVAALVSRYLVRTHTGRVHFWRGVYVALVCLPLLQGLLPAAQLQLFNVQHAVFETTVGTASRSISLGTCVVLVWAAGTAVALLRLFRDWRAAHAVVGRSAPLADVRIERLFAQVNLKALGGRASLRTSDEITSPCVFGWRRPVVLVPASIIAWNDNEIRAMLLHELEHARRFDWPVLIAERVVGAFYWPNVLLIGARRSAAAAREVLADQAVLRAAINPGLYAAQLLRLARTPAGSASQLLTVAMSHDSVEHRVRSLFSAEDKSSVSDRRTLILGAALSLAAVAGIATIRPWTCAPSTITQSVSCN